MIEMSFSFFSCSFLASMPKSWLDGKSGGNVEIWHFHHSDILYVFKGIKIGDVVIIKVLNTGRQNRVSDNRDVTYDFVGAVLRHK